MKYYSTLLLVAIGLLCSIWTQQSALADNSNWVVEANPYRIQIKHGQKISKKSVLAIDPKVIIDQVSGVAVDQVNPHTGAQVGRFQLIRVGKPFDVDGSFRKFQKGHSPWLGFEKNKMAFKPVELEGKQHRALMITKKKIANSRIQQKVRFANGKFYLLEYWIMMEPITNGITVTVKDPALRLFSHVPHSYYNKMPPYGQWASRSVLFYPRHRRGEPPVQTDPLSLQITHPFTGHAGVADIRLQEVAWRLIVEPDEAIDKLDLYMMARAGHRLTVPTEALIAPSHRRRVVLAKLGKAEFNG
ncbi:MAG: hypothetical protein JKX85_06925 [Phycisphaeraceae bacterium]|nr:hypothetical protein [Phycisphaeraceae bacterium]